MSRLLPAGVFLAAGTIGSFSTCLGSGRFANNMHTAFPRLALRPAALSAELGAGGSVGRRNRERLGVLCAVCCVVGTAEKVPQGQSGRKAED